MEQTTKVITGIVRFSYAHVWEPWAMDGAVDKKYSVSIIIPKSDKKTLNDIQHAIDAATELARQKSGGKLPARFKFPLRDGDDERPNDEAYAASYYINANCKTKPGVVDANVQPILDQTEFYSGCYGRASITFYPFDTNGNRGVACGLNNVMKTKDGDSLGGRAAAETDFADYAGAEADSLL